MSYLIKQGSINDMINTSCIKTEVKTETDEMDDSKASPNSSRNSDDEEEFCDEKNESRKRKADSLFEEEETHVPPEKMCKADPLSDSEDEDQVRAEDTIHRCNVRAIFNCWKSKDLLKALREGTRTSEKEPPKALSCSKKEEEDKFVDDFIDLAKLWDLLKAPLPSFAQQKGAEKIEFDCISYEWRNDVENPVICGKDESMKQIAESILAEDRSAIIQSLIDDLNCVRQFDQGKNKWSLYGSHFNGLVCVDSDIHILYECIRDTENSNPNFNPCRFSIFMRQTTRSRLKNHHKFRDIVLNIKVRYESIRGRYFPSDMPFEIAYSNESNLYEMYMAKTMLTKVYLDMYPNLKHLILFVRIILQRYRIHGTMLKFRTYTIFWLVVFFMQLKKLLPAVIDVRKSVVVKNYISGWDCSLPESYSYPTEPVSLYALLLEFLHFYKNFDFLNYVICPFLGRGILLSDFERMEIPKEEFSLYLRHASSFQKATFVRNVINLQDPTDLCCNVAEFVTAENANKFKMVCHRLSERLAKTVTEMEAQSCFCDLFEDIDFDEYSPYGLIQYHKLLIHTDRIRIRLRNDRKKQLNQMYVLEAIRKLMESVFKFEKKSIIISQNITKVYNKSHKYATLIKKTPPVFYFEYRSSESTFENDLVKEIIPREENENEQIRIYIICEVCLEHEFIKMLVQGDVHFVKFLLKRLPELFKFTLLRIIPNVR